MPTAVALTLPPVLAVLFAVATALGTGINMTPKTGCTPATCDDPTAHGGGHGNPLVLSGPARSDRAVAPR
ncbi:MAG: hypothetical protein AAFQ81_01010 [Pseudomonadota bacterium]